MVSFAFRNLLTRPLRSMLSLLGLTVAIAGMVGLFSVAEGLDREVGNAFGRLNGLTVLQPGAPIPLFSILPAAWGDEIVGIDGVRVVSPEVLQRINVINGVLVISPPRFLQGIDLSNRGRLTTDFFKNGLKDGRYLDAEDVGTTNCVVSRQIADDYGAGLGDTLTVNSIDATVVGIYETGSALLDVVVLMDMSKVREITRFDAGTVSDFYVEPEPGVEHKQLAERIEAHFAGREMKPAVLPSMLGGGEQVNPLERMFDDLDRIIKSIGGEVPVAPEPAKTPPVRPADVAKPPAPAESFAGRPAEGGLESAVQVRTASDWTNQVGNLTKDLDLILMILTSIGVSIALLSIVNTMLMSVTERIIDFGILKANGWSKFDVLRLITVESGLLGFTGGVLGAAIGWGGSEALNASFPDRLHLYASPGLLAFALAFSTILGVLAGLYPAVWAMRMMPMDAIRRG